ncbi:MAG TPA: IS1634 family transposase [Streptosporangiaceae bacterium]|nr:IS1634 family transposase [Streptosporangiaceae bacterium]
MPYVKTSVRTTRSGTVRYLQLAHNEWDQDAQRSRTRILHNFGREDEIDKDQVRRLVAALSRLLDPAEALAAAEPGELSVAASRPLGGTHALDGLWRRLGLDKVTARALEARPGRGRRPDPDAERVLFALVANRALAASSKLACAEWVREDVHVGGLPETSDDACYRVMDRLLEIEPVLAEQAYHQVTDLLNLEVDLLFFDTTSAYFETEAADDDIPRNERGEAVPPGSADTAGEAGFRTHGKSKDSRDDLPQVIVGMAVTRDGIPARVWSWPGNTADSGLIRQVKKDLREWTLSKVIWVADRGFTSEANRRALMRGGGGYIIGEKLRSGTPDVKAALSRQGRYKTIRDNLQVKEVRLGDDDHDRFIICFNPEQAERDAAVRARLVAQLEELIDGSDAPGPADRGRLEGSLAGRPGLKRFLRVTPGGLLRTDKAKIAAEENLDGKYLLRCSDPHMTTEDIALGYRQLLEVERGWRDMKQVIDLRPVYHRREDRIRAHVILCWLALLLMRVAENEAGRPWNRIRADLQRQHAVTWTGPAGTFRQATDLTKPQRDIYTALNIEPPKKILTLTPAPATL